MAKQVQLRRGTTAQHSAFTGALGEVTVDTDKKVAVVHDGSTAGGIPLAKQATVDTKVDKVTSTDNAIVRFDGTTGQVQNSNVYITDTGNLLVGTTTDNGVDKLQVNGSISALPPSFGIQQQVNNHRKLYCFYTYDVNQNRLKLTISGNTTFLSFVLNIVYSDVFMVYNQSAIREYSFKRLGFANTSNFSEIGTGLGSPVTVISSNEVTDGYEVVLGFNAGGHPQFDIEIINHQRCSSGTITGEFLTA